jgi:restriction system protein
MPPMQREWLCLSPDGFERLVVAELRKLGQPLESLTVQHQLVVSAPDGEFEMDAVATFKALGGDYLVLVECKHHRNPIKRELVQVLATKLASSHAQKAMLFATGGFQARGH